MNLFNFTHEFFYNSSNKKILLIFFRLNCYTKLKYQICCIFKTKWFIYFSPKRRGSEAKVLKRNQCLLYLLCTISLYVYVVWGCRAVYPSFLARIPVFGCKMKLWSPGGENSWYVTAAQGHRADSPGPKGQVKPRSSSVLHALYTAPANYKIFQVTVW